MSGSGGVQQFPGSFVGPSTAGETGTTLARSGVLPTPPGRKRSAEQVSFDAAYRAVFGEGLPWGRVEALVKAGVPVSLLPRVAGLLDECVARWGDQETDRWGFRSLMLVLAESLWIAGRSEEEVGWALGVMAGAPTRDKASSAYLFWMNWHEGNGSFVDAAERAAWLAMPTQRATVGWAAGLTPAEAATAPVTDLRQMAALRGWVLSCPDAAMGQ